MIKAISYWSLPQKNSAECPLEDAVRMVSQAGFNGFELTIGTQGIITPSTDRDTCMRYRDIINASGLTCQTLASGMSWGCSPTHPDPAIRRKSIELHAAALQRAAWLGVDAMLFVPGAVRILWDSSYQPVEYSQAVDWARQAVAQLTPVAQDLGIDLCVENVWNGLFYSPLEFRDFIDSFKSPRVKAYFDVGNVLGYHQYPPHWIELLGARIGRVHIKDYKMSIGGLAGFCDLLAGDVPWRDTFATLKSVGYDKTIVAEMMPSDPGLLARTSAAMNIILQD